MAVEYYVQVMSGCTRCCAITDANTVAIFIITMVDTVLPADSLEFCPNSGFHDILVCGTYKLEELSGTRRGQCLVFKVLLESEEQLSWYTFL